MEVKVAKTAGFCFGVKRAVEKAYEVADEYRNPVIIAVDGMIGQMMEPVVLPEDKGYTKEEDIPKKKPWALTGHKGDRDRNVIKSLQLKQELRNLKPERKRMPGLRALPRQKLQRLQLRCWWRSREAEER